MSKLKPEEQVKIWLETEFKIREARIKRLFEPDLLEFLAERGVLERIKDKPQNPE